jgi:hypothetical protein
MSNKILIAAVSAILLASTGLASAQTRARSHAYGSAPYVDSYFDQTYWNAVGPHFYVQPDPYAGTIWEGVAPY